MQFPFIVLCVKRNIYLIEHMCAHSMCNDSIYNELICNYPICYNTMYYGPMSYSPICNDQICIDLMWNNIIFNEPICNYLMCSYLMYNIKCAISNHTRYVYKDTIYEWFYKVRVLEVILSFCAGRLKRPF